MRVELNQLREKLDEAIQTQDFTAAAEIKAKVNELEDKKESLISEKIMAAQEIRQEKVQNKLYFCASQAIALFLNFIEIFFTFVCSVECYLNGLL